MSNESRTGVAIDRLDEVLRILLVPLVFAGLGELLLNRTVSRATIFIPKDSAGETALAMLASLGFFLLALAFLIAVAWLGAWALRSILSAGNRKGETLLPALLLFFAILSAVAISGPSVLTALIFAVLFVLIITLLLVRLREDGRLWKALVLTIWTSYVLYAVWVALSQIESLANDLSLEASVEMPRASEVLALAATPILFLVESRARDGRLVLSSRAAAVATIPTALFAFLVTLNRALIANISIWSTGFSLFLPFPVYAAAIWFYTVAILGARRRGRRKEFLGYLLILVAGYNLNLTYPYVVAVIALILLQPGGRSLIRTDRSGTRPEPRSADPAP